MENVESRPHIVEQSSKGLIPGIFRWTRERWDKATPGVKGALIGMALGAAIGMVVVSWLPMKKNMVDYVGAPLMVAALGGYVGADEARKRAATPTPDQYL
jgi:hypothetical protein